MTFLHHQIYEFYPDISKSLRNQILKNLRYNQLRLERSHHIKGRWENHYLDPQYVPEVNDIFKVASNCAREITVKPVVVPHKGLGFPMNEFWFNVAKPGEKTDWHDHKEKALISGVYYLKVPQSSGDIQFRVKENNNWQTWNVQSVTGKMILFSSKLEHAVTENLSEADRISLAFNLYTLPLEIQTESTDYSAQKFFS